MHSIVIGECESASSSSLGLRFPIVLSFESPLSSLLKRSPVSFASTFLIRFSIHTFCFLHVCQESSRYSRTDKLSVMISTISKHLSFGTLAVRMSHAVDVE